MVSLKYTYLLFSEIIIGSFCLMVKSLKISSERLQFSSKMIE